MKTNSNSYTIIYSIIIVVIVAFLLAFVSRSLAGRQHVNEALDKKKQILNALNIRNLSDEEAAKTYKKVVLEDAILDPNGNVLQKGTKGADKVGFKLNSADFKKGKLALYICNINGKRKYVIPVYGMGLWGPINGYIAINDDKSTIFGVYFNHDSETAGLGAEIKDNKKWQDQFIGKKLFANDPSHIALTVMKANDITDPSTQVDAVTGATLTSNGVSDMLHKCLDNYLKFLKPD